MAIELLMIPNEYPHGLQVNVNKTIVEGQLLPYNTANALVQITGFSITSNVVTFTTTPNSFTTGGGDAVFVAGFTGSLAYLNGAYTTSSATSTTLVVPLTHANVASTSAFGLVTLNPNYTTGGIALGGFYSILNGQPTGVGTIGPLNTPDWIDVKSLLGTRQYPVNLTVSPALVLNYTLAGAQATTATAFPTDNIGFRAEFVKNAF